MARGRPSLYKPEHCNTVIALGKEGKSLAVMAAEIGVDKDTLYEWQKVHPDFSDAMTRARTLAQAWWENIGQENLLSVPGMAFNASVWSRSMAARFPDDWREKSESKVEHSGSITKIELAPLKSK